MMIIDTLRFGQLEISEDQIFQFPMGILGFSASKSFVIIDLESQKPFIPSSHRNSIYFTTSVYTTA